MKYLMVMLRSQTPIHRNHCTLPLHLALPKTKSSMITLNHQQQIWGTNPLLFKDAKPGPNSPSRRVMEKQMLISLLLCCMETGWEPTIFRNLMVDLAVKTSPSTQMGTWSDNCLKFPYNTVLPTLETRVITQTSGEIIVKGLRLCLRLLVLTVLRSAVQEQARIVKGALDFHINEVRGRCVYRGFEVRCWKKIYKWISLCLQFPTPILSIPPPFAWLSNNVERVLQL